MPVPGAGDQIRSIVSEWPEVRSEPHRFGGLEFRVGRREIGHIHGDRLVDVPFPRRVRNELVASGGAAPHHILPGGGWVSVWIDRQEDLDRAIALLRKSYELALERRTNRTPAPAHGPPPGERELTRSSKA